MAKCHTGMSMHNKACSDRIPNCLRISDSHTEFGHKGPKASKKLKTVATAGKIRLSFLDVKGLLYSKLMPTAQLLTCETPRKLKL